MKKIDFSFSNPQNARSHSVTCLCVAPQLQVDSHCIDQLFVPRHFEAAVDTGRAVILPPCCVDQGGLEFSIQLASVHCSKDVTSQYNVSDWERKSLLGVQGGRAGCPTREPGSVSGERGAVIRGHFHAHPPSLIQQWGDAVASAIRVHIALGVCLVVEPAASQKKKLLSFSRTYSSCCGLPLLFHSDE